MLCMSVCMYVWGCSRGAVGVQGGNRSQGVPKIATKSEDEKKEGVPLTLSLYFERFLRKMGSKMEPEIDQKSTFWRSIFNHFS